MRQFRPLLIIAIILIAALIGSVLFLRARRSDDSLTEDVSLPTNEKRDKVSARVVTLEEFGDYQSLPCAQLHPELKKLKLEFGRNLNLVFRNLPLLTVHKNSLAAAEAAEAARVQNRFWEMHDLLYENQLLWKDESNPQPQFVKFARDLGLDVSRFVRDLKDEQVKFRIEADRDAALRLGIEATPAILINGRRLKAEAMTPHGIREGIEVMMNPGS